MDASPGLADEILHLLSAGRLDEARDLLCTVPPNDPFFAVARFDLRLRTVDCEVPELERLADSLTGDDGGYGIGLWAWVQGMLAERLLLDQEPDSTVIAEKALAALGTVADLPPLAVYARARLRRVLLAGPVFDTSTFDAEKRPGVLGEVLADLRRGDHLDEAVLTTAFVALFDVVVAGWDVEENVKRLQRARSLLSDERSLWPMLVDHMLLLASAVIGDRILQHEVRARVVGYTNVPSVLIAARTMAEQFMVRDIPDDDLYARWSRTLAATAAPAPVAAPPECRRAAEREVHVLRLEIQSGRVPPADEIVRALDRVPPPSRAPVARLVAGDLAAVGAADALGALAAPSAGGVRINVLCPLLEVIVHGRAVPVGDAAARLLVCLAAVAPAPVHVEQLGEQLWPGQPPAVTRRRLNGLLHRVRTREPALGEVVVRAGATVALDPGRCEIDLLRYRTALHGDPGERLRALAEVRGNLCHAQFPYDEHLIEERHRLAADWQERAHEAAAGDAAVMRRLDPARRAMGA